MIQSGIEPAAFRLIAQWYMIVRYIYPYTLLSTMSSDVLASGDLAVRVLNLDSNLHIPAVLLPGYDPWYPLNRRLSGSLSRSKCRAELKNIFALRNSSFSVHTVARSL
jgi:hypothetical protein